MALGSSGISVISSSPNCKDTFPVPPVIAYRRHASRRDLLVHFMLYEFTNATIHAVSPVLFSKKAKQINRFLPQLMSKEKSLTTYPANQKILST